MSAYEPAAPLKLTAKQKEPTVLVGSFKSVLQEEGQAKFRDFDPIANFNS
jgi:hypothetical protein